MSGGKKIAITKKGKPFEQLPGGGQLVRFVGELKEKLVHQSEKKREGKTGR